jgi:hypothetical protein
MATRAQIATAVDLQLAGSKIAGKERRKRGDMAVSARYDRSSSRLKIELASGIALLIPTRKIQGLADAKPSIIDSVQIAGRGYGLHWPTLDLDLNVPDLLAGCFGSKAWMSTLARRAGRSTSKAKAAAARVNGRRGGRPRKPVTLDDQHARQ